MQATELQHLTVKEHAARIAEKEVIADLGRTRDMFGAESRWVWDKSGDVIIITDMGGELSVTEDITHILKTLRLNLGKECLTTNVIYRDERGIYDGIRVDNVFNYWGFFSIYTADRGKAIKQGAGKWKYS